MAQRQFDKVADLLDLDSGTRNLLRDAQRDYHFLIPVRMDDGRVEVFKGFRVQHNDARGPSKATPEADDIPKKNGTFVIPDFLANEALGMLASRS